ncbi:MAG: type II toxin-antitoxin system VapC family toxin [Geminicoccaceae bacterium]
MFVLDASALLALLFKESGHERVAAAADGAAASTVNLAEVLTRFVRDGHTVAAVLRNLEIYAIEWVPFDDMQAAEVATLWPRTRRAGLSLADRACLALALDRSLPVLTADRVWAGLALPIDIRLIR